MAHRHTIQVRYGECDMQGVVFNAHYLAYCDDAVTSWVSSELGDTLPYTGNRDATFDFMLKKAEITWTGPLTFGEVVDVDCSVERFGRSSMEMVVRGSVAGETRFEATLVQVAVDPSTHAVIRVPDLVREKLSSDL